MHDLATTPDRAAVCTVRCTEGVVRVGQRATKAQRSDGSRVEIDIVIESIKRYGRDCEFIDPPHSAMVQLVGGVDLLQGVTRLYVER